MRCIRSILGILFVVIASDAFPTWYWDWTYRDEYTSDKVFIRVGANLTQVPDDMPDEATEVNLRYNMITDIPINAFSNLRDCQILRLSWNEISVIESGSFNGLLSLTQLNLINNQITTLGDDSFSGLTSLIGLDLAENKITTISDRMFSSLKACTELSLRSNNISEMPEGVFTSLSSLTHIYLDGNNIQTVPANVFPNTLESLHLSRNKITALEDDGFKNLVLLTGLSISSNRISTIPASAFSTLSNCKSIVFWFNPIENIEVGAFHGLDKVTVLSLDRILLTHLSQNVFQGLPSLWSLQMEQGRISEIARGAFTGLYQLQHLRLARHKLTVIESYTFSSLVSLEELDLHQNHINDIKDFAFLPLGKLTRVYLYGNQLEHLRPNAFAGLRSLELLDLAGNKLTTLDPFVLSPLPRPLNLSLDYQLNPMVCDVKLCWLKVEEEVGRIVWYSEAFYDANREPITGVHYPNCTSGVDWLLLQCPATIPCSDPGQVAFAERSGSFLPFNNNAQPGLDLPYSTDSEFTYTCDNCYTGGGNIFCQSIGQWTRKPECTRSDNNVVCRAPVLVDGYLTPSYYQYECGVRVTFTCNQGSKQTVGVCGSDGRFIGGIRGCVENETVREVTELVGVETFTTTEGSSRLIYGLVGAAVGGIVVTVLIVLTIYCVIRSRKENQSYADTARTQDTVTDGGYIGIDTDGNGLYEKAGEGASEAGYIEPVADRGKPGQRVTGDDTVYSNTAYENEYQEIKDALSKDDPYDRADVDGATFEN